MTTHQKVWLISFVVLLVCILIALLVYIYTRQILIAIIIAPPIIHWMLKRREKQ